jgi:hypothetical protein
LADSFGDIYLFFLFESIDVASDIEVVIVFFYFIEVCDVRELLDFFSLSKGIDDFIGVFFGESILGLAWLEFF